MGEIQQAKPVKLFIGMLSAAPALFGTCADLLRTEFGPTDYESEVTRWEFTTYYEREMGSGLLRKFIFFERLIDPGELAGIKILTNRIEDQLRVRMGETIRRINLDPGYVTEAKVVLASTKDYSHRISIGKNIYAEVTLVQKRMTFTPLEHTYPDYRTDGYIQMFNTARSILRQALQKGTG